jgi:hypothetical protein
MIIHWFANLGCWIVRIVRALFFGTTNSFKVECLILQSAKFSSMHKISLCIELNYLKFIEKLMSEFHLLPHSLTSDTNYPHLTEILPAYPIW